MAFEWYEPKMGILLVSIANYGITFYGDVIEEMGIPAYVSLGFDEKNRVIGVKTCDKVSDNETDKRIKFAEKRRNGYVRICDRNFIRFMESKTNRINFGSKPKKYLAQWDAGQEILYIYLDKNLD